MPNRPKISRKRLYVFDVDNDGFDDPRRFAVVHTSLREAKKWLWADFEVRDYCYGEYIRFNPHWLKGVDVSDRYIGDDMMCIVGIERGVYLWIDGLKCPLCGKTGKVEFDDDWEKVCCSDSKKGYMKSGRPRRAVRHSGRAWTERTLWQLRLSTMA